ncbi:MAG TPA: class I SAM-dependent methyltransferase [Anaerolineales bacterium]|nr:class I SAM-dependent methyltransferase [Anaerolineales bacterium]
MDWHRRYLQQAKWTRDLRKYLFDKSGLDSSSRLLEVGCGTGAILSELNDHILMHGLDIDQAALDQCRVHVPGAVLVRGNALQLPYSSETFDIVYSHFLLLWLGDPLQALLEMKRVAKTGAHILAFAEPDYGARIDQPGELAPLGEWQAESLRRQGANPRLGAQLADLFFQAGIEIVETGPIQIAQLEPTPEEWEAEWAVIESDLRGFIPAENIHRMKRLDQEARARGVRLRHVPTYFAWGRTG